MPTRRRRRCSPLIAFVTLCLLLAGCAPASPGSTTQGEDSAAAPAGFPRDVVDASGDTLHLQQPPRRVCFLAGTPLNIFYDLGGHAVCATVVTDNMLLRPEYAAEVRGLPSVGQMYDVNVEAVTLHNPDLVITMDNFMTDTVRRVRELGIPVLTTKARTFAETVDTYRLLGKVLGNEDAAEAKVRAMQAGIASTVARMPASHDDVVILYVTSSSLGVKLDNSIAGDVVKQLGVHNMASGLTPVNAGSENTPLDVEAIVRAQPRVVLVTSMIGSNAEAAEVITKQFAANAAWQAVDAVRAGRVHMLPQQYFLYNAGPYYPDAVAYLAACLHPDVFGAPVEP